MQCRIISELFSIAQSGHSFTPPSRKHNDTAHLSNLTGNIYESWHESQPKCAVKYLSHQVELRAQSLGKKDSESGSNVGHLPAKNI